MLYSEKFFNLTEGDEPFLQSLIDNKLKETLNLEYKKEMIDGNKFARKVVSFANTSGGIIIMGIEEKDSLPIRLNPLEPDLGETIENILITSISGRIPFKITAINSTIEDNKKYYVIYVPKSSNGPHMVISEKDFRYYKRAYVRTNFSSIPMSDSEVRDVLEKNLKYKKTQISQIRDKRILFYDKETWEAQKEKLIYLRYTSTINDSIDIDLIKSELKGLDKKIDGDVGQLLSNRIVNYGKSILFENGLINYPDTDLFRKRYLSISKDGYIEFVRLGITKNNAAYKVNCLRDSVIIDDLKYYLQFLGIFYKILKYIGETIIFIRLNNIDNSVIYTSNLLNEFSQRSSEPSWEDSNYYQTFEIIDNSSQILKYFADGIFKNYGYDDCFKLKSEEE
jgi:hypothetical protein